MEENFGHLSRRQFLGYTGMGLLAVALPAGGYVFAAQQDDPTSATILGGKPMPHELPDLPYAYDALEPYYDAETVRLHHDIHHAGYVKGLNAAEAKLAELTQADEVDPAAAKTVCRALAFHGSGDTLHTIFWKNMKPGGGGEPGGALAAAINAQFGSYAAFKKVFLAATNGVDGSGWGILAVCPMTKTLVILQAEKHENQTQWGVIPILALDVWEHAYYLKYQNKRPEWTRTFMEHLINWDDICQTYDRIMRAVS